MLSVVSSPMRKNRTGSKLDELEQQIIQEMRRTYSEKTLDHAMRPRNVGRIEDPDGYARVTGPCGDTMEIYLRIETNRVTDVKFWTDGCGTAIACGSVATEFVKDKTVAEASKVRSKQILGHLGGLPESDLHCAILAARTLNAAIRDYRNRRRKSMRGKYPA